MEDGTTMELCEEQRFREAKAAAAEGWEVGTIHHTHHPHMHISTLSAAAAHTVVGCIAQYEPTLQQLAGGSSSSSN
jgi:hypothetical protein